MANVNLRKVLKHIFAAEKQTNTETQELPRLFRSSLALGGEEAGGLDFQAGDAISSQWSVIMLGQQPG